MNWGRLLQDGIPFADLVEARDRHDGVSWIQIWAEKATHYERLGEQCLSEGSTLSAGYWLWLASLCAQYGQFLWFDTGRERLQERKEELYARAAPHLRPSAERVEISVGSTPMTCYVRRPPHIEGLMPSVILLGGLESTKEESYLFENLLLERGMATLTFDGPGQGEMLRHMPLSDGFERYTSAAVDHLIDRQEMDSARIGVLGRSLGGLYALRSAGSDPRLQACVSWGGFVTVDWDTEPLSDRASWQYVTQSSSETETREKVEKYLDSREFVSGLTCPTYFLHGALDSIPMKQINILREHAVDAEIIVDIEPNGDHCCHNLGPAPRLRMADWLAHRLGATTHQTDRKERLDGDSVRF